MSTERLGDFIRRIRTEKNLSCADVSKRSARKGQQRIAGSYINRIENDRKLRPSADKLKALADGLDIPADELLARSVGLIQGEEDAAEVRLLARFRNLSPERKADVLRIIELWH
ncbi:MAG TPA: helix-turn-helix transcriptional regulator [Pyrinomonadaceae bacterium]